MDLVKLIKSIKRRTTMDLIKLIKDPVELDRVMDELNEKQREFIIARLITDLTELETEEIEQALNNLSISFIEEIQRIAYRHKDFNFDLLRLSLKNLTSQNTKITIDIRETKEEIIMEIKTKKRKDKEKEIRSDIKDIATTLQTLIKTDILLLILKDIEEELNKDDDNNEIPF